MTDTPAVAEARVLFAHCLEKAKRAAAKIAFEAVYDATLGRACANIPKAPASGPLRNAAIKAAIADMEAIFAIAEEARAAASAD